MHLTLKQETAMPPLPTMRAQQRAFDHFRKEYNVDRPHAALGQRVPADYYQPSTRTAPEPIWGKDFQYDSDLATSRLDRLGRLRWAEWSVKISDALANTLVGLKWCSARRWDVYFGPHFVGAMEHPTRHSKRTVFLPVASDLGRGP